MKVHKLGAVSSWHCQCDGFGLSVALFQLVQSFKSIRGKAIGILREMSAELLKISEQESTAERRKAVVEACMPIMKYADVSYSHSLAWPLLIVPRVILPD